VYKDYIPTITKRFEEHLSKIEAQYGFDYGDEFEFALIDFLDTVLPEKFGVRRGHASTFEGSQAGDDLIVFDRIRMPTIGLRDSFEKYRKTRIPVEAIYSYIEVKHTLILEGDGPQSMKKACAQVAKVRNLCATRAAEPLNVARLPRDLHFAAANGGYPDRMDPTLGVVFARNVKVRSTDKAFATGTEIEEALHRLGGVTGNEPPPDLMVLGPDIVITPHLDRADKIAFEYVSPFYLPYRSNFGIRFAGGHAAAIAVCTIMYALDLIRLGPMPWRRMLAHVIGAPLDNLKFNQNPEQEQPPMSPGLPRIKDSQQGEEADA
jgi:hypothetical protein